MTNPTLDQAKIDAFAGQMVAAFNGAALAMMTSLGHRTELFDRMAELPPSTSEEIAAVAELNERYVREWLGAMVTAGVVQFDPARRTYELPPEHAACLTRAAVPNNLAATSQWISIMGQVEDRIAEAFVHGRGVPYSAYPRFHEVMAEESGQTVVAGLLEHIVPLLPEGAKRLQAGIDVLDVGCGSGAAINFLAASFPQSRFTGHDFSAEGVAAAQAEAQRRGLANVKFEQMDAARMDTRQSFDLITAFDAIHDQAAPDRVLANIARALRPDGIFLMQDIGASSHVHENIGHPLGTFIYTISCMHCMSVSLAHGGPGLGAAWGKELALTMLAQAGFAHVEVQTLPHDAMNYYYLARLGA